MNAAGREASCHLCGSASLAVIDGYEDLRRVTSDAKPWRKGGLLALCTSCGVAQAVVNDAWHKEAAAIYADYGIYLRSGGKEQVVFDSQGAAYSRSDRLFRRLKEHVALAGSGDVLDIGCGNGGTLRSFAASFPAWRCHGHDLNDRFEAEVRKAVPLQGFYTGAPGSIPKKFDLVTMFHALEHIPAPREFLRQVISRFTPDGMLFVQLPDCALNPFALLVADHSCHFWKASLQSFLDAVGLRVVAITSSWVAKEISCLAVPSKGIASRAQEEIDASDLLGDLQRSVDCLMTVRSQACDLARSKRPFGIFGTAITATWLLSELDGDVDFFVDEDHMRVGTTYFDKPILSPADVPERATVYLPFTPEIASSVCDRLGSTGVLWVTPPVEAFQLQGRAAHL